MKTLALLTTTVAALALAAPAEAATLQFTLSGFDYDGTYEFSQWQMSSTPTPLTSQTGTYFETASLPGTFSYGDWTETTDNLFFYSATAYGTSPFFPIFDYQGIVDVLAPKIFSGTYAKPTFATGNYTVYDYYSGAALSLVVAAAPTAAVPEPASWAMMISGFGLVGGALRTRKTKQALTA